MWLWSRSIPAQHAHHTMLWHRCKSLATDSCDNHMCGRARVAIRRREVLRLAGLPGQRWRAPASGHHRGPTGAGPPAEGEGGLDGATGLAQPLQRGDPQHQGQEQPVVGGAAAAAAGGTAGDDGAARDGGSWYEPRNNVAPGAWIPVLRLSPEDGALEVADMRWGCC
jgi:hypothetical protein